ncbi:MAG: hypothetical protein HYS53_00570 [Candidatus Aenigmarchaeota archaeon]|nr:hypothetical protein [Candidatus Aenigmarchaeota archaeon]
MDFDEVYRNVWDVRVEHINGTYISSEIPQGNCIGEALTGLFEQHGYRPLRTGSCTVYSKPGVTLINTGHHSFLVGGEQVKMEAGQVAEAIKAWNKARFESGQRTDSRTTTQAK